MSSLTELDRERIRRQVASWPPLSDDDVAHVASILAHSPAVQGVPHELEAA